MVPDGCYLRRGLAVAAWLLTASGSRARRAAVPSSRTSGSRAGRGAILGLVSTFVEPVVKLLSLPFIILTLGFLLLVINAAMLLFTAWLADIFDLGFHVDGFWNALVGSIIITIVGWGTSASRSRFRG